MTKAVNFKDNNWLKRWPLNKKDRGSGFTLVEIIVVIAIIGILVAIVVTVINPVERFKEARDARRKTDIRSIVVGLNLYFAKHKYYPKDIETLPGPGEGCDSSRGSSVIDECYAYSLTNPLPPAWTGDWDKTSDGIWKGLVGEGFMLSLPKDPQNYSKGGWWYKYEPASPGEVGTGCPATAPGPCYYYIAARLEAGRQDLYSKGYPGCVPGSTCTWLYVCEDYPDDAYFTYFRGPAKAADCGIHASINST